MSNILTTLLSARLNTTLEQTTAASHSAGPANTNSLMKHIAKFDQWLAHLFYWLIITVGLTLIMIALLDISGLFDYMGWW
jgi:hypothetical protein